MTAFAGSMGEAVAVAAVNTGTASSTPLAGTAIKMDKASKAMFVFLLGDMAAETIDCIVETCDSNGSNNASLKAATQLAGHATNNDNKRIVIAVEEAELIASGKQYVRGKITTGNTVGGTCTIVALQSQFSGSAADVDDTSVVEVKP